MKNHFLLCNSKQTLCKIRWNFCDQMFQIKLFSLSFQSYQKLNFRIIKNMLVVEILPQTIWYFKMKYLKKIQLLLILLFFFNINKINITKYYEKKKIKHFLESERSTAKRYNFYLQSLTGNWRCRFSKLISKNHIRFKPILMSWYHSNFLYHSLFRSWSIGIFTNYKNFYLNFFLSSTSPEISIAKKFFINQWFFPINY